jgi:hypothetical protein
MKFTLTISEEVLNTIVTALRFEKNRAEDEGNNENLGYINRALEAINDNTYVANVKEV